jgi:hypothetical protein
MSTLRRALAVVLLVTGTGLGACGGGDDDDADDAAGTTVTTGERTLSVCGVEERTDRISDGTSAGGDFADQRAKAIEYLDAILEVRALGRPAAGIATEYRQMTQAYAIVRAGFDAATTPDAYLAEVQRLATEAFGTAEEVDRIQTVYEAWVEKECGFDPELGIQLFAAG